MKRKLIALFVLLGSAGLAQAGCSSCGCGCKTEVRETVEDNCPSCGKCKTDCCCGCCKSQNS